MSWKDEIEHVILLILENRSFDHILGDLKRIKPELEGIDRDKPKTNFYRDKVYPQIDGAKRILSIDPKHERPNVIRQLHDNNGGFVESVALDFHDKPEDWAEVMKFHALGTLPAIHQLAETFTICDRWFASVPGPTWPNRLFALSGTSLGRIKMPEMPFNWNLHWYDQTTIFDRLNEKKKTWAVFHGDFPLSFIFVHQLEPANVARHKPLHDFYSACTGPEADFPNFCLIEPSYNTPNPSDDHPPHDIFNGQALIANLYNAIRGNEKLWRKSLFVIFYDEHGGFYDHVSPPATTPPDHHTEEFTFDTLGVRIPALLVSPWIGNGILNDLLDHTAFLKFLIDKWGLGPLGARAAQYANVFEKAFLAGPENLGPPQISSVPKILTPNLPIPKPDTINGNQAAIVGLSHAIESISNEDPKTIADRLRQSLSGPQSQMDLSTERVESFIARGKTLAKGSSGGPL